MQIYVKQNLAFLAVPKTGSTAIEMGLRRYADIAFSNTRKHVTAGQFHDTVAPFLQNLMNITPERMAVMRHPVDHLRSWYRYRSRDRVATKPQSTQGISFDQFVLARIGDRVPPYARTGSQYKFLTKRDGTLPLHHLFAYEHQDVLLAFLQDRFNRDIALKPVNVSPPIDAPLSPDVDRKLRAHWADEFALYDRVIQANGHFRPMTG